MGSRQHLEHIRHGPPRHFSEDTRAHTKSYAESLDAEDPLRYLRNEFLIPTKQQLVSKTLPPPGSLHDNEEGSAKCIYLCGNSLGLQPRALSDHVRAHLDTWATKGVNGHFAEIEDSPLPPFLHIDEIAAEGMVDIVGAVTGEVAVMETLTANLHLLMASFYRPTKERYKILIEGKAFPSDHYAVESQIYHHNLDPRTAMIMISPPDPSIRSSLTTAEILQEITTHAASTALILLPGVQYYTGQLLDIPTITRHAHSLSIPIGFDLAHAVGNVPLSLHAWGVDFAAWCNYKYINAGPGAIAGLFVHEKHGTVEMSTPHKATFKPRLSGWWGGSKDVRFRMDNQFIPTPGAFGWQVGNPSALALAALTASLATFKKTDMVAIRQKSLLLTGYLEHLLMKFPLGITDKERRWSIITPANPEERGAQLSVRLEQGLLATVMVELEENGVVVDERKPDVVRVAPAPLYNEFREVWEFVQIWRTAVQKAVEVRDSGKGGDRRALIEKGVKKG